MWIQPGQPALYGMAVDIGYKMNLPPGAGIAESGDRQPHTPVAAAYADMHDVAPAALGVGQPNEIIQPLPFGGYFIDGGRSEEHTSELQSLMRISYAVFCLKKNNLKNTHKKDTKNIIREYTKPKP